MKKGYIITLLALVMPLGSIIAVDPVPTATAASAINTSSLLESTKKSIAELAKSVHSTLSTKQSDRPLTAEELRAKAIALAQESKAAEAKSIQQEKEEALAKITDIAKKVQESSNLVNNADLTKVYEGLETIYKDLKAAGAPRSFNAFVNNIDDWLKNENRIIVTQCADAKQIQVLTVIRAVEHIALKDKLIREVLDQARKRYQSVAGSITYNNLPAFITAIVKNASSGFGFGPLKPDDIPASLNHFGITDAIISSAQLTPNDFVEYIKSYALKPQGINPYKGSEPGKSYFGQAEETFKSWYQWATGAGQ